MGAAHPDLISGGPQVVEGAARSALVTGPAGRAAAVSQALKERGFDLFWAGELGWLNETTMLLERSSVDCYVQLPTVHSQDGGGLSGLRSLISGSILPRFDAAAAVLPMLRVGASVVLVPGEPLRRQGLDDPCARLGLLHTLARAITTDRADVRVIVVGRERSYEEIAEIARRGRIPPPLRPEMAASHAPELDFSSWRQEIVSFVETDSKDSVIVGL